jgi:hypothetical protein
METRQEYITLCARKKWRIVPESMICFPKQRNTFIWNGCIFPLYIYVGTKRLPPSLILVTVQNHSLLDAFTFPLIFYHCKFSQQIKTPTIGTVVDQNKIGQSVTLDSFTIQRFV